MCLPEIVVPSAQVEIEFILLSNWPDAHPTPTHEMLVDSVPFTYYLNIGSRDVQTLDRFLSFVRYQLKKREKYYIN
jgi:hypothetical protein